MSENDELTDQSRRLSAFGAILMGVAGVTGLALIGTGNFDGYAQGLWAVAMLVGGLVMFYVE